MSQQLVTEAGNSSPDSSRLHPELVEIIDLVGRTVGVDLHHYRTGSITRRAENRLRMAGCRDYREYLDLLAREPQEAARFLEYVVIKWSRFFRDAPLFELLRSLILPDILAPTGREVSIWSAGCGRGEEAYSLAILLDQVAGPTGTKTTIYATDIDEGALAAAQERVYSQVSLEGMPDDLLSTCFMVEPGRRGTHYRLSDRFAASVHFRRHDLLSGRIFVQSPSFHLVLCRNVLIYFQRQSHKQVLDLLAFSLAPGGYLCLGEAEQLSADYQSTFETVDRKLRVYRKRWPASPEDIA